MDEVQPKKIKKWHWIIIGAIVLVFVVLKIIDLSYWPTDILVINGKPIDVIVADTPTHLYKGLSNRKSLGDYQGMLFKFDSFSRHTMVMRDMDFALDFVWINNGIIVDMAPNVQPEPGKSNSDLTLYTPRLPADQVLELPAGFIASNGLKIGDSAQLKKK